MRTKPRTRMAAPRPSATMTVTVRKPSPGAAVVVLPSSSGGCVVDDRLRSSSPGPGGCIVDDHLLLLSYPTPLTNNFISETYIFYMAHARENVYRVWTQIGWKLSNIVTCHCILKQDSLVQM